MAAHHDPFELTSKMWDERSFADAQIICGTRSFAVHRNVLCASSLEFTNLFNASREVVPPRFRLRWTGPARSTRSFSLYRRR